MTWLKLDNQLPNDPRIVDLASASSALLYVYGLCHCSSNLTDGLITVSVLRRRLLPAAFADEANASELVDAGLWEHDPDGYRVANYLKWNRSRESVETERARDAERKRRSRGVKRPAGHRSDSTPPSDGSPTVDTDTDTETHTRTRGSYPQSDPRSRLCADCGGLMTAHMTNCPRVAVPS